MFISRRYSNFPYNMAGIKSDSKLCTFNTKVIDGRQKFEYRTTVGTITIYYLENNENT